MAPPKKFEIQFLQDYDVQDENQASFKRGRSYKLAEDSAAHFINRHVACLVPADGKLPAGVSVEVANKVSAKAQAIKGDIAKKAADELNELHQAGKVAAQAFGDAEKALAALDKDATKDEKKEAAEKVASAKLHLEKLVEEFEEAETANANFNE